VQRAFNSTCFADNNLSAISKQLLLAIEENKMSIKKH
jgi:hypothetical protein